MGAFAVRNTAHVSESLRFEKVLQTVEVVDEFVTPTAELLVDRERRKLAGCPRYMRAYLPTRVVGFRRLRGCSHQGADLRQIGGGQPQVSTGPQHAVAFLEHGRRHE